MTREFAITAPDARMVWLLPGLATFAAVVAIAYAAITQREPMLWLVPPVLVASLALLAWMLRRTRVTLDSGTLAIAAGMLTRRVAVADLALDKARIVDLREHRELQPLLKVFGAHLPGHASGHFRLRDRRAAFVLLTDRSRVLVLPEKTGKLLLLSLRQPQALLDALKQTRT